MDLQPHEKIIKTVYRATIVYFWGFFFGLILILAACVFIVPLIRFGWWGQIIFGLAVLTGILVGLRTLVKAFGNRLVITNQRLIIGRRQGLFKEYVLKISYERLKSVDIAVKGLVATIFRLGSLVLNLVDSGSPLIFSNVRRANQIQELIIQLKSSEQGINWQEMDDYQLIDLARKIRDRLGRDVLRRIVDEPS